MRSEQFSCITRDISARYFSLPSTWLLHQNPSGFVKGGSFSASQSWDCFSIPFSLGDGVAGDQGESRGGSPDEGTNVCTAT